LTPYYIYRPIGNIDAVEAVQRIDLQSQSMNLSSLCYSDRLVELSLETLELRRLKQDLMMCFKIIDGDVEIDPVSFFKLSTNCITRGHNTSCSNRPCVLMPVNLALLIEYSLHGIIFQLA